MSKKKPDKNPGGRPTKYKPEYVNIVYHACREGGFSDKRLCALLDVAESTLNLWKQKYPDFYEAMVKGKDEFDTGVAEKALLKRVKGYSFTEVTREPLIVKDLDGSKVLADAKLSVTKKVRKHVPPNPTSIVFFLKNRAPQRWKDQQEVNLTGLETLADRLREAHKRIENGSGPEED